MNTRKKLLFASVASAVLILGGGTLASNAFAQDGTGPEDLVNRIASKFNVKQEDVQGVFDQYHAEIKAERQKSLGDRLNQAVTDGKITAAQRDLIVAKQAEIQTKMDEARKLTDTTARRAAMDAIRSDVQAWAKQNNIPEFWLRPGGGRGHHGGPGMHGEHHGMHMMDDNPSTSTN